MNKKALLILFVISVFLYGFSHITFPVLDGITRAEIRTNQNKLIKQVSDPKQILAIVSFVNARRSGWSTPWYGVPVPPVVINFYAEDKFVGHFGWGKNFFETQRDDRGFFSRDANLDEINELELLLGFKLS